jgi:hypothetical protein
MMQSMGHLLKMTSDPQIMLQETLFTSITENGWVFSATVDSLNATCLVAQGGSVTPFTLGKMMNVMIMMMATTSGK